MSAIKRADRGDEWVSRLSHLFLQHPAWTAAAGHLTPDASSTVYFSQRPGEPWRLEQRESKTRLLSGAAPDPDFAFRFTPRSIERLEMVAADGGIAQFAVMLFSLIAEGEVGFRIVASFPRLVRRGYVKLLRLGGVPVVRFGALHGIQTLKALRRFVSDLRSQDPADWEVGGPSRSD